ncbi:hypothetical protein BJY18_005884 [Amycolatopsis jiangsuensis]|uniref:Uncharacterized protein n=1 Tax=Amycolatopsis jiangsuensis TaxID=1181879 RepID=A0A840J3U8_9PSEU|nr:hypothetical protein [Amycolatopsis jiangsuensis]MBB4688399.1 hypothetical protein [Amycolatopsis jiangsuensis]
MNDLRGGPRPHASAVRGRPAGRIDVEQGAATEFGGFPGGQAEHPEQVFGHLVDGSRGIATGQAAQAQHRARHGDHGRPRVAHGEPACLDRGLDVAAGPRPEFACVSPLFSKYPAQLGPEPVQAPAQPEALRERVRRIGQSAVSSSSSAP